MQEESVSVQVPCGKPNLRLTSPPSSHHTRGKLALPSFRHGNWRVPLRVVVVCINKVSYYIVGEHEVFSVPNIPVDGR